VIGARFFSTAGAFAGAGAGAGAEGRAAADGFPRRYRMEFALAAEAGAVLDGAAWRDGDGWSYRLTGADGSVDRFRAHLDPVGTWTEETA